MASSLQQSEQVRRDMTADIAHETAHTAGRHARQPEAMLDGVYPFDAEHLTPVLNQVNFAYAAGGRFAHAALAEAGQLRLEKRPSDPGALIQHTITSLKRRLPHNT